jgi:hypothetical protein
MKWFNNHINFTYSFALVICLYLIILAIITEHSSLVIAYFIVLWASSVWVIWRKKQNWMWLILISLVAFVGIPALFIIPNLRNKTQEK